MDKQTYNTTPRLISYLERILSIQLKDALKKHEINLSVEEFRTLFYLWHIDGLTQNKLAEIAYKEKSLITKTINTLEKKDLIKRERKEGDRRNKLIFLTKKSKLMAAKAFTATNEITKEAEQNILPEELAVFKKVLIQMTRNLK